MKKLLLTGAFVPLFLLTACGEGWEMRTYEKVPYQSRTAGSGVEYVRAHMMPAKGTNVPKVKVKKAAPVEKQEKKDLDKMLNSGEKFFRDLQKK